MKLGKANSIIECLDKNDYNMYSSNGSHTMVVIVEHDDNIRIDEDLDLNNSTLSTMLFEVDHMLKELIELSLPVVVYRMIDFV